VVRLRGYLLALAVCWMAEGGRLLWKTGGEGKAEARWWVVHFVNRSEEGMDVHQ